MLPQECMCACSYAMTNDEDIPCISEMHIAVVPGVSGILQESLEI